MNKLLLTLLMALVNAGCSSLQRAGEGRRFEVRKVWVRSAPGQPTEAFRTINRATPLVAGSQLITANSQDGVTAWHRESGRRLWHLSVKNGVEGGMALVRDRLFFGASDGQFYCVDVRNGQVIWNFQTHSESLGEPLLDTENGVVYLVTSVNTVHALEADSGRPLWAVTRQDTSGFSVRGATRPSLHAGLLYVGFSDGFFSALDARTGQVRWEVQLNRNKRFHDIDTTPFIDKDRLYVAGYDDRLYCLSTGKGEILWKVEHGGFYGPTVIGSRIYYATSTGDVMSLDRETGKSIWNFRIQDGIATSIVNYKGLVAFGESQGSLRFLDAVTGREISSFSPGRGVFSTPYVEEKSNRLYFISNEANVYALEANWKPKPAFPFAR